MKSKTADIGSVAFSVTSNAINSSKELFATVQGLNQKVLEIFKRYEPGELETVFGGELAQAKALREYAQSEGKALAAVSLLAPVVDLRLLETIKNEPSKITPVAKNALQTELSDLFADLLLAANRCAEISLPLASHLFGLKPSVLKFLVVEERALYKFAFLTLPKFLIRLSPKMLKDVQEASEANYIDYLCGLTQISQDLFKQVSVAGDFDRSMLFAGWALDANRLLVSRRDPRAPTRAEHNAMMADMRLALVTAGMSAGLASYLAGYITWNKNTLDKYQHGDEWKKTKVRLYIGPDEKLLNAQLTFLCALYLAIKIELEGERDEVFSKTAFAIVWAYFDFLRGNDFAAFEKEKLPLCRLVCGDDLVYPILWLEGQFPVANPTRELAADRFEISAAELRLPFSRRFRAMDRPYAAISVCKSCGRLYMSSFQTNVTLDCPWCGESPEE